MDRTSFQRVRNFVSDRRPKDGVKLPIQCGINFYGRSSARAGDLLLNLNPATLHANNLHPLKRRGR